MLVVVCMTLKELRVVHEPTRPLVADVTDLTLFIGPESDHWLCLSLTN